MYTCSYSSNPIYLPFDASPSEHVNIFYFTLNYRDFANYRFRKLQISQTADFANYRFRKLQISQTADFVSFRFVSFRFVNYSKPIGRLSKQQQDICGKRANVWGVSEWPLRMSCCCFESRPMTMQRVIRI